MILKYWQDVLLALAKISLLTIVTVLYSHGQSFVVNPYLQNADPNSIIVMWETDGGATHLVDWGTSETNLDQSSAATSISSSGSNLIHQAIITGLTANTRYYYQAISDTDSSAILDFITPPLKSSEQSFNLIAMSDMQRDGSNPNKFNEIVHDGIIDYLDDEFGNDIPTDLGFVMIPGDLVVTGTNYSQWQNHFFGPSDPLFSHVPVYPVLGNHEQNAGFYFQYFSLPENGTTGFEEHWYYKDYSNVRIIGLNSNGGYRIQEQLDWLETVLNEACIDEDIDFVFAQLHHPHKSELWTPGELNYTGDVIELMETFSSDCGKPSIHFFGHTHGYSRGQSRDHEHLWVNVATAGGAIDNWGEFPNADYEEFNTSIDEYGFVILNVEAGDDPKFTLRRISRGDSNNTLDNVQQDTIVMKKTDDPPATPLPLYPIDIEVNPNCVELMASNFDGGADFHQASHWQVSTSCTDFSAPVFDRWWQHENWYNEIDTQADDDLFDERIEDLNEQSTYCWRVRYRDQHLKWSEWSEASEFTTGTSQLSENLILNGGAESSVDNWEIEEGVIESLAAGECNGINPHTGTYYFTVGGLCANETSYSEVSQLINIVDFSAKIDQGEADVVFGGQLSNFSGSDQPRMKLDFLDVDKNFISSSNTLTTLNSSWTALQEIENIPNNSRFINVILTGTRNAGTDNDSYFDELSVQIDTVFGEECSELILPVDLLNISASCKSQQVQIYWEVSNEIGLSHYEIETSYDAYSWRIAGSKFPDLENPETITHYQFDHLNDEAFGLNYYRLKIYDIDGFYSYSPVVSIKCKERREIKLYPNPNYSSELTIWLSQDIEERYEIELFDNLGSKLKSWNKLARAGSNEFRIDTNDLNPGVYNIRIKSENWIWSESFIQL